MKQWNGGNEHKEVDQDKQFMVLQKVLTVVLIAVGILLAALLIVQLIS